MNAQARPGLPSIPDLLQLAHIDMNPEQTHVGLLALQVAASQCSVMLARVS
jgi:hypothetical protein